MLVLASGQLKWEKERRYAIGTWFYKDKRKSTEETFKKRLDIIQNTINIWHGRNLTWIGRITVMKTLLISKFTFAISSMEVPQWFINEIETLFQNFLWNNKPPRIKQKVMFNNYENGGRR